MIIVEAALSMLIGSVVGASAVVLGVAVAKFIRARWRRVRMLRQVVQADMRMLSASLTLATEHFRAANQLAKRGEHQ